MRSKHATSDDLGDHPRSRSSSRRSRSSRVKLPPTANPPFVGNFVVKPPRQYHAKVLRKKPHVTKPSTPQDAYHAARRRVIDDMLEPLNLTNPETQSHQHDVGQAKLRDKDAQRPSKRHDNPPVHRTQHDHASSSTRRNHPYQPSHVKTSTVASDNPDDDDDDEYDDDDAYDDDAYATEEEEEYDAQQQQQDEDEDEWQDEDDDDEDDDDEDDDRSHQSHRRRHDAQIHMDDDRHLPDHLTLKKREIEQMTNDTLSLNQYLETISNHVDEFYLDTEVEALTKILWDMSMEVDRLVNIYEVEYNQWWKSHYEFESLEQIIAQRRMDRQSFQSLFDRHPNLADIFRQQDDMLRLQYDIYRQQNTS